MIFAQCLDVHQATPAATLLGKSVGRMAPATETLGKSVGRMAPATEMLGKSVGRMAPTTETLGKSVGRMASAAETLGKSVGRATPDDSAETEMGGLRFPHRKADGGVVAEDRVRRKQPHHVRRAFQDAQQQHFEPWAVAWLGHRCEPELPVESNRCNRSCRESVLDTLCTDRSIRFREGRNRRFLPSTHFLFGELFAGSSPPTPLKGRTHPSPPWRGRE